MNSGHLMQSLNSFKMPGESFPDITIPLQKEIAELRSRLFETEETLRAIRNGEVDAIVVSGNDGEKVFSLTSSETPYRNIIEVMDEGALTVSGGGTILYCNQRFADMLSVPIEKIIGNDLYNHVSEVCRDDLHLLLQYGIRRPVKGKVTVKKKGKVICLQLSLAPLPSNMEGDICIVVSDITEISNYQQYLKETVDRKTEELRTANQKLSEEIEKLRKAEKLLHVSEERYALAIQAANLGTWDHIYLRNKLTMIWSDQMADLHELNVKGHVTPDQWFKKIIPADRESVKENLQKAIEEKIPFECEYRIRKKDKTLLWINITGKPVYDIKSGCLLRMNGIARNVTDMKKAEHELLTSELRYRLLSDTMLQGVMYRDNEGKIISLNPAGEKILGLDANDIIGRRTLDLEFLMEDGTTVPENEYPGNKSFRTGLPSRDAIFRFFNRKEKQYRWIRSDTMPLFHEKENKPYQVYTVFEDITEQKKAESELLKREEFFRSAFDEGAIPMSMTTPEGRYMKVNRAFCKLTGFTESELMKKNFIQLTHPDDRKISIMGKDKLLNGTIKTFLVEKRFIRKNGRPVWVSLSSAPVRNEAGDIEFLVTHSQDINKRKIAESRLKESQEKFKQLANSIPQLAWMARADGYIYWFNQRWYEYTGTRPMDVTGWGWQKVLDTSIVSSTIKQWKAYIRNGKAYEMIFSLQGKDGINREFLTKSIPIKDKEGKIEQWFGTHTDISQLKKVEKELKISRNKLNIALENGKIGTWQYNLATNEMIWDDRAENMFRVEPGKLGGTFADFRELIHEEDLQHLTGAFNGSIESGKPFEVIFRLRPVNGESNYISLKALVNKDRRGKPLTLAGVCFDVTDMKKGNEKILLKLNEELLRSNKDLQQFAYVASHDLQEPLRMVSSFTQLLLQKYKDKLDDDGIEYIHYAVDGAKRMYELLNGLLAYSRVQTRGSEFGRVDMNNVLAKVQNSLNLIINETGTVIESPVLPEIIADENQMIQLMQNLIENSIKFSSGNPLIRISVTSADNEIVFSIRDQGIGIEEQYFDRIFKIFQRLHRSDEYSGTGIGLAICKRIIERHSGKIWVESEPGKGSSFFFSIPVPYTIPNSNILE
jgi:PAS domain S-box-containing protein